MPTPSSRSSGPRAPTVTSADELGSLKVAAAKGTTQELGAVGDGPEGHHHAHRGRCDGRRPPIVSGQAELFATNSLIIPDLQKRNPEQGVRAQVHHPPQPRPHGRAHGRAQSGALARQLHLLQHDERRDRPAAPESGWACRWRRCRRSSRRRSTVRRSKSPSQAMKKHMSEIEWSTAQGRRRSGRWPQRNAIVIVPIGATEQHGPHLPSMVDWRCVHEVSHRAARHHGEDDARGGGADHPLRHVRASHVAQRHHHARLRDDVRA